MYFEIVLVIVGGYNCGYFFCNCMGISFYVNINEFFVVNFCVVFVSFIGCFFIVYEMFCIGSYFMSIVVC